jgi:hypothetical protein
MMKRRIVDTVEIFRVVTPFNVVIRYQPFRGPCCLHLTLKIEAE